MRSKTLVILGGIAFVGLVAIGTGVGIYFLSGNTSSGGVVTNGYECAEIGGSILRKGGSAADSAIAALLCEGVAIPQSMGIGGGFFMTIYDREKKKTYTINAREKAPELATDEMFQKNASLISKGGLAVAVPGELRGYWEVHKKFGKLPWAELFEPAIKLCEEGHLVTEFIEVMLKNNEKQIRKNPTLSDIFIDKNTNKLYKKGDKIKRLKLAETFKLVAQEGADALYNGTLTKPFVEDIKKFGGVITEKDMNNYQPEWLDPIKIDLPYNQSLFTMPLPGSGVILTFIMNILKNFLDFSQPNSITTLQRIIESFKYAYAKRSHLGDPNYVDVEELVANLTSETMAMEIREQIYDNKTFNDPEHYGANFSNVEDHGTAHLSVIAPNGDAVAVTSTINLIFGAGICSPSTGIILNDEMDDFSYPGITNSFDIPPSPANYMKPGKRPMSSMTPTIITDSNDDVRLVIGAAGGSKITTIVALVSIRHLWFNETLSKAIEGQRFHHQLLPMEVKVEPDFDEDVVKQLQKLDHKVSKTSKSDGFAALTALSKIGGKVEGVYDPRRGGAVYII